MPLRTMQAQASTTPDASPRAAQGSPARSGKAGYGAELAELRSGGERVGLARDALPPFELAPAEPATEPARFVQRDAAATRDVDVAARVSCGASDEEEAGAAACSDEGTTDFASLPGEAAVSPACGSCSSEAPLEDAVERWEEEAAPPMQAGPTWPSPGVRGASQRPVWAAEWPAWRQGGGAAAAQPVAWGARSVDNEDAHYDHDSTGSAAHSAASRRRAVAAWVETSSPHTLRHHPPPVPSDHHPWDAAAGPASSLPPSRGSRRHSSVRSSPLPAARFSSAASPQQHARHSAPVTPRHRRSGGGASSSFAAASPAAAQSNPVAALGALMHGLADVQRALLVHAQMQVGDAQGASGAAWRPPLSASSASSSPATPASAAGSIAAPASSGRGVTRRLLLMQRLDAADAAAAAAAEDDDDEEEAHSPQHSQPHPFHLQRSGDGSAPDFSFPASGSSAERAPARTRPMSPQLWHPSASPQSVPSAGSAPRRRRCASAASERSDGEAQSAASELGSEMDLFRAGLPAAPARASPKQASEAAPPARGADPAEWWRETIPEEEGPFENSAAGGGGGGLPVGSPGREQRRASLAERRVVALELALEEAVGSVESTGWERDALVTRTAEAEAAAADAQARATAAAQRLQAEQRQCEYLRRLVARTEEARDAARAEAKAVRQRAAAGDRELRLAVEALDVRDAEALALRARLRSERVKQAALAGERDVATEAFQAAHARGALLHTVLGLALAACLLMALRLVLGTRAET